MKPRSLGEKMGKCWQCVDKGGERQGEEGRGGSGEVGTPRLWVGATWWTMGLPQGEARAVGEHQTGFGHTL